MFFLKLQVQQQCLCDGKRESQNVGTKSRGRILPTRIHVQRNVHRNDNSSGRNSGRRPGLSAPFSVDVSARISEGVADHAELLCRLVHVRSESGRVAGQRSEVRAALSDLHPENFKLQIDFESGDLSLFLLYNCECHQTWI